MKNLLLLILGVAFLIQCGKTNDYCEMPPKVIGAFEFGGGGGLINPHNPSRKIKIYLKFESNSLGDEDNKVMYSFSTPDCFINPKGDYTEDIVTLPEYTYTLKDTANPPASVDVYMFSFNDCGRTDAFKTTIVYN